MIVLYVILALVLLLVAALFINVHLIFRYDQSVTVTLRILFFRMDGMKLFHHLTDEKGEEPNEKQEVQEPENVKSRKLDLFGFAQFLIRIARVIALAIYEHLTKMKINLKEFHLSIGTDDAAKTAMVYSVALNAANGLCALLQQFSRFRCVPGKLFIAPDFAGEKTKFSIHLDISSKPIHILAVLYRSHFRLLEGKEVKNERDPIKTGH